MDVLRICEEGHGIVSRLIGTSLITMVIIITITIRSPHVYLYIHKFTKNPRATSKFCAPES
jgi:hypothetical protein